MIPLQVVQTTLRRVLIDGTRRIAGSSPTAAAFAFDAGALKRPVLLRHTIEHVFRIRMFRPIDTLAERLLREQNASAAQAWARYARSEAVHDRYFLRDLAEAGLTRDAIARVRPFDATVLLGRFVESCALEHGPAPILLYSFWAEENSDAGTSPIVHRMRTVIGDRAVRGAAAHRRLDETLNHGNTVAEILAEIIQDELGLLLAIRLLDSISTLIGGYFSELDAWSRSSRSSVHRSVVAIA